jgi:hypothetical protein
MKGQRPKNKISDFSGKPSNPCWPREPILGKVQKVIKSASSPHLVAYLDYGGGVPDLAQVAGQVSEAQTAFQSVWLLTGGMFALLFDQIKVGYPGGNWCCYLDWLPPECQP